MTKRTLNYLTLGVLILESIFDNSLYAKNGNWRIDNSIWMFPHFSQLTLSKPCKGGRIRAELVDKTGDYKVDFVRFIVGKDTSIVGRDDLIKQGRYDELNSYFKQYLKELNNLEGLSEKK